MLEVIGLLSLNLATFIYLIRFFPQLVLSYRQRQTQGLSLSTHFLLLLAYWADLIYGYGQHLPWQYKLVTVSGLLMLGLAHYQFWVYHAWRAKEKTWFGRLSGCYLLLLIAGVYDLAFKRHSTGFYNLAGSFSWCCWLSFSWPQWHKNFSRQSVKGLSFFAVLLALLTNLLDWVAAFALGWAWPSKLGSLLGFVPKMLLLSQYYLYKTERFEKEAAHASR